MKLNVNTYLAQEHCRIVILLIPVLDVLIYVLMTINFEIIGHINPWRRANSGADLGGGGGGGGGSRGSGPPLSYMKNDVMHRNDVMHTVIYAAFCMLPSLDLQACTSF